MSLSNFTIFTIPSLAHCCRHSAGPISGMSRSQSPHTQVNLKSICDAHRTPSKSAPSRQQLRSIIFGTLSSPTLTHRWTPSPRLITHTYCRAKQCMQTPNKTQQPLGPYRLTPLAGPSRLRALAYPTSCSRMPRPVPASMMIAVRKPSMAHRPFVTSTCLAYLQQYAKISAPWCLCTCDV